MSTAPATLDGFDPASPDFLADPHAVFQELLRQGPVLVPRGGQGAYHVLGHEAARSVFMDSESYSSVAVKTMPVRADLRDRIPEAYERVGQVIQGGQLINMDAPAHTLHRRALQRTFTHKRVHATEPDITALVDGLLDGLAGSGRCDLMQDFAMPLTLRVVGRMLNLPPEMLPGLQAWINDVFAILAPIELKPEDVPVPDDQLAATYERLHGAYQTYSAFLASRRADPGDDLASAMLTLTGDDGRPALTGDEVLGHMVGLTAAGTDTTANLIVNMVRLFTAHPEQLTLVLDDPALWDNAVQEGLRRSAIVQQLFRISTRESVIAGVTIPERSHVIVSPTAANADPAKFPDPLRFDVRRANAGEHLALGRGRHFCLGSPLVLPEARIALQTLYRRLPGLKAELGQPLRYVPSVAMRGVLSQRVTWDAPSA
jgi:cytochrome P450